MNVPIEVIIGSLLKLGYNYGYSIGLKTVYATSVVILIGLGAVIFGPIIYHFGVPPTTQNKGVLF